MITARYASSLPVACCLAAAVSLWPSASCTAGDYTLSAHGNTTTGVSRKDLNSRTTGFDYVTGNCAHCHEQHASVIGSEPSPTGGPGNYLGMANETGVTNAEQTLCFYCHGTTAGNNESTGTNDNIYTDITKAYKHTLTLTETAHRANETLAEIAAAEHVECTDCHNPHAAGHTMHTKGIVGGNAITTNASPLYKATGVEPSYSGMDPNWADGTIGYGSYSAIQTATKEYQVCFKCHSKANTNVENQAGWGGSSAGAWTDVGLEFNPYNNAFHPIVKGLSDATSGSSALAASTLLAPWNVNMGTQTMYCTDCHASDSGVAGPHGSAVKWMLAGTNKAWPYTSSADNGTSDATPAYFYLSSTAGLFCRNCHPAPSSTNTIHQKNQHQTATIGRCLNCHIRVPHGGKVSRLISAASTTTNLPARYWPDGNGGATINGAGNQPELIYFNQTPPYGKANCKDRGCVGTHNASSGESW